MNIGGRGPGRFKHLLPDVSSDFQRQGLRVKRIFMPDNIHDGAIEARRGFETGSQGWDLGELTREHGLQ